MALTGDYDAVILDVMLRGWTAFRCFAPSGRREALRNPRQVLERETIVRRVWGYDDDAEYNNLAVYLSFLRKKLTFIGAAVEIRAHRGIGYALEEGA